MSNTIPPVNNVELDRSKLVDVLEYLGYRIGEHFSRSIRLVVHGGACMLLHPGLYNLAEQQAKMTPDMPIRRTTRDVDYIHRAFVDECMAYGEPEAPGKLSICIRETAVRFRLGADWMNSAADVALPMTTDPSGRQVDPIYTASIQKSNIDFHTIFSSANGMLRLISVAPFWAVSLKLVRYTKWDPSDICLLLKYGTIVSRGPAWSRHNLEQWLSMYCWSMGYASYPPEKKAEMRKRIKHAIQMVNEWFSKTPTLKEFSSIGFRTGAEIRQPDSVEMLMGTEGLDTSRAEWGGGDRTGWKASFAGDWVKPHEKQMQPLPQHLRYSPTLQPQQHSNSNSTFQLSPPFNHQVMTLESAPRPKVSSNVADWLVEKERDQKRVEEKPWEWKREKKEEAIEPFIPPVHTLDSTYHRRGASEGALLRGEEYPASQRPILQRRTHSHPITPRKSNASFHGIYESVPNPAIYQRHPPVSNLPIYQHSPVSKPPRYHTQPSTLPNVSIPHRPSNAHQTPPIYHQPSCLLIPQLQTSPYALPIPPIYQYTPPTKIHIKTTRKKKGKARDRAREKARSAKHARHTHSHSPDADGLGAAEPWWKESRQSRLDSDDDDDDGPPVPVTPPTQASPAIFPLTTVVYYNEYQEQQQEQQKHQQHQSLLSFSSPHASPPQAGQVFNQPPPPMWVSPASTMQTSHHNLAGAQSQIAPGGLVGPAPTIYSHPYRVIPPHDYYKSEKTGTLSKLMSALKI